MLQGNKWVTVYDAKYNQDALSYTMYGLTTCERYSFRVSSVDFNGMSIPSAVKTVYACGIPSDFAAPTFVQSDKTSIKLKWLPPLNNGGCDIYDYGVYRDNDASGLVWTEVNPAASYIRNDPYTFTFTCITFPPLTDIGD